MTNKIFFILIILIFYILLPIFILFGVLDFNQKFIYLTFGALGIYIVLRIIGIKNSELGITTDKCLESIKSIARFTLIVSLIGAMLFFTKAGGRFTPTETIWFYLFYVFLSSPAQEFLYRGALSKMLSEFGLNDKYQMIISSALYSYVHIIYKDTWTLLLTFMIGLIWFKYYKKTQNLIGVSLSHAMLGGGYNYYSWYY